MLKHAQNSVVYERAFSYDFKELIQKIFLPLSMLLFTCQAPCLTEGVTRRMNAKYKAMLASFGRSFLGAAIAVYATGNTDVKSILIAAAAATVPVALRAINPKDPAFGLVASLAEAELKKAATPKKKAVAKKKS
jgi:hypothetical protein